MNKKKFPMAAYILIAFANDDVLLYGFIALNKWSLRQLPTGQRLNRG